MADWVLKIKHLINLALVHGSVQSIIHLEKWINFIITNIRSRMIVLVMTM